MMMKKKIDLNNILKIYIEKIILKIIKKICLKN